MLLLDHKVHISTIISQNLQITDTALQFCLSSSECNKYNSLTYIFFRTWLHSIISDWKHVNAGISFPQNYMPMIFIGHQQTLPHFLADKPVSTLNPRPVQHTRENKCSDKIAGCSVGAILNTHIDLGNSSLI